MSRINMGLEMEDIEEERDEKTLKEKAEIDEKVKEAFQKSIKEMNKNNLLPDASHPPASVALFHRAFDTRKLTHLSPTATPRPMAKIPTIIINHNVNMEEETVPEEEPPERQSKSLLIKLLWGLVHLSYITYMSAVIIIHSKIQDTNYWCEGDGFLFILTSFIFILILYFKCFKPLFGKYIYRKIMRPIGKKVNVYMDRWYIHYFLYIIFFASILAFLVYDTVDERERLISIFGIVILLLFGFVFSIARRKIRWRQVAWGIGLQYILGFIVLKWALGKAVFQCFANKVQTYLEFTDIGSGFVYGELSSKMGIFAFKVLSVILFFSFCIQILYYYGAMQWMVIKIGWLLQVTIGTTACESMNAAANIFLGQTEAPLMIKPFLSQMTKSELHAIMTGGFATIAGTVMAAYISFGVDAVSLLTASVMNAPAALAFSKLFYPEEEISVTKAKNIKIEKGKEANVLHAAIEGVSNAIPLVANIGANLIAVIAFVGFLNAILNWGCLLINLEDGTCSLSNICGYGFMLLAWAMGVPWVDAYYVGQLIGMKVMINEFVAYVQLTNYQKQGILSKRAEIIATYALCGFSNLSSIGIVLGGLGPMAPERKGDMAKVVIRAMIAGNVASLLSACIAGTLLSSDVPTTFMNETLIAFNSTS